MTGTAGTPQDCATDAMGSAAAARDGARVNEPPAVTDDLVWVFGQVLVRAVRRHPDMEYRTHLANPVTDAVYQLEEALRVVLLPDGRVQPTDRGRSWYSRATRRIVRRAPAWLLEEKATLRMYAAAGWTVPEVAKVLGTSPSTLNLARRELRITGDRRG